MQNEIERLSQENNTLKQTLEQYDKTNILQLTKELLKLKTDYLALIEENKYYQREYQQLIHQQQRLNQILHSNL